MEAEQQIFTVLSGQGAKLRPAEDTAAPGGGVRGAPAATTSDTESGIFPGESELCAEHESELDWFCATEQKVTCARCVRGGSCQGHSVTPLAGRVSAVRVSVRAHTHRRSVTCDQQPMLVLAGFKKK